ncbi:hypothetical protein ABKN59_005198 [Abortiporus biennis]
MISASDREFCGSPAMFNPSTLHSLEFTELVNVNTSFASPAPRWSPRSPEDILRSEFMYMIASPIKDKTITITEQDTIHIGNTSDPRGLRMSVKVWGSRELEVSRKTETLNEQSLYRNSMLACRYHLRPAKLQHFNNIQR